MFADRGEAIVFWISVAGLIFLAIIVLFRYFSARRLDVAHRSLQTTQTELRVRIDDLEEKNERLEISLENLRVLLQQSQLRIDTLRRALEARPVIRPQPDEFQGARPPATSDTRSAFLKGLFKIQRQSPPPQTATK